MVKSQGGVLCHRSNASRATNSTSQRGLTILTYSRTSRYMNARKCESFCCISVQCNSCAYEGSGKALKDHELMHILPDELKFTSDEDIHKWREERKRFRHKLFYIIFLISL